MAENALNKHLITRIKDHTQNRGGKCLRLLAAGTGRTNFMDRGSAMARDSVESGSPSASAPPDARPSADDEIPSFELGLSTAIFRLFAGDPRARSCNGGGATAIWNVNRALGLVADIGGCKMMSAGHNVPVIQRTVYSGHASHSGMKAETPYVQALVGAGMDYAVTRAMGGRPQRWIIWISARATSTTQTSDSVRD